MNKNQIAERNCFASLNDYGNKFDYPFVVLIDGQCCNSVEALNDNVHVGMKVLRPFNDNAKFEGGKYTENNLKNQLIDIYVRILNEQSLSETQQVLLCKYGKGDMIEWYNYDEELSLAAFQELIKRNDYNLFSGAYLQNEMLCGFGCDTDKNFLYDAKQFYLVQNASSFFLKRYLMDEDVYIYFSEQAEIELVKRRDLEMWTSYVQIHARCFGDKANALIESMAVGDDKIKAWYEEYGY